MKQFDPSLIPRFTVIRIPYTFAGSTYGESKRFVILGHKESFAVCIKATSKVEIYKNNPEKLAGCVYYTAREISLFETDTAIEPDNPFPVPHSYIANCERKGSLEILGTLPNDFQGKIAKAIEDSSTLSRERKRNFLELVS